MRPREGAFAEQVAIPERNLVEVPEHITLAQAALAEPIAVSWHAVRLGLAALHPADQRRAHVLGGGAIGVAAVLALKAMGIESVTLSEPNGARAAYLRDVCDIDVVQEPEHNEPLVLALLHI